jgi:uncharacterized cofD-like protein
MGRDFDANRLPRIVVIGGGTGLSVMLRGLKQKQVDITAIVTVADDGGSSGILRSEMQMLPPGDIRNVLSALADEEPILTKVLQYRFQNGGNGLAGHSLGNLILAAMQEITGDFVTGVKELSKVLAVRGRVLPSSEQSIVLKAEMKDGSIVVGESKIPKAGGVIKRVFLDPQDAPPLGEALEAIREADAIVIGPGSLYTSILPNLLVSDIAKTIMESHAVKMYVCNVMTQPGETDEFTVCDHLQALEDHVGGRIVDYVLVNNSVIPKLVLDVYAEKKSTPVGLDLDKASKQGYQVIADKLVRFDQYLRHDAQRLSDHIYKIIQTGMADKG